MDKKNRHETVQNHTKDTRGAVGTPTRAVACSSASKPQQLLPLRRHIHPCCRQHVQKLQKPQLLTSKETKIHSFASVRHRHLHGSASAPSRRSCSHSWRRRRCRPATEMKPRRQRDSKRDKETFLRDGSFEMTTRHTSLAFAIVVAQQLDGVALHAVHLIA